jgi:hypothetical protein
LRTGWLRFGQALDGGSSERIDPNRPRDILDLVLPGIREIERQLVPDRVPHYARDRDAAWLGECLKSCRDVDTVTEQVTFLGDYIAKSDAHPKGNARLWWRASVPRDHSALNLDRATHGLNGTGELDQHAIAGGLDDLPAMFLDLRIDEFSPVPLS